MSPIIVWIRRDLRLGDHHALSEAARSGRPVIPVFVHDEVVEDLGAAPKWRFGLGVEAFAKTLRGIGSRLILRRGRALDVMDALIAETGAKAVYWQRAYDPAAKERDILVKTALKERGVHAQSFAGHLLFEPWTVATKLGGFYKVFTPYWRSVKDRVLASGVPAVQALQTPSEWPKSDNIGSWNMGASMYRGAAITVQYVCVGEQAALARLGRFVDGPIENYKLARDIPGIDGTSRLSENLTYGEISPRTAWVVGQRSWHDGVGDAEIFLKELVWREFAYHLLHHTPQIATENWRTEWDAFPWQTDIDHPHVLAWRQGRTGIEFVDAAMRELFVSGYMHNRARMIVASYLTKHLMTHWQVGQSWFEETLVDWDPAANAMGWQWAAGCGPDAAPYFRVFNPVNANSISLDADRIYARRWIAEGQGAPPETANHFFAAIPRFWKLSPDSSYPVPIVSAPEGRKRALDAYGAKSF